MRNLLAAAALAAGLMGFVSPASAYVVRGPEAPWCAIMNMGTGVVHEDCSYASLEACRPNIVAGNRGFCNPNPAYRGEVVIKHRRHARRHARHY